MEAFLIGLAGGIVPGAILMIFYIVLLAGRIARIETNVCWLIKELKGCLLRSKDRIA